jgi:hypothetical protein
MAGGTGRVEGGGRGQALGDKYCVPITCLAYLTLAARKRGSARYGQTRSGLVEDALAVAAGFAVVLLSVDRRRCTQVVFALGGGPGGRPNCSGATAAPFEPAATAS